MEARNLSYEQSETLQQMLKEMQKDNPALEYTVGTMEDLVSQIQATELRLHTPEMVQLLRDINEKLDALDRKLDHVFDDYVIIDGRWVKTNVYEPPPFR